MLGKAQGGTDVSGVHDRVAREEMDFPFPWWARFD